MDTFARHSIRDKHVKKLKLVEKKWQRGNVKEEAVRTASAAAVWRAKFNCLSQRDKKGGQYVAESIKNVSSPQWHEK